MRPLTTQKVTSSGSSAASSAFSANIEYVRIIPDADCHIEFGTAPTATNAKIFLEAKVDLVSLKNLGRPKNLINIKKDFLLK